MPKQHRTAMLRRENELNRRYPDDCHRSKGKIRHRDTIHFAVQSTLLWQHPFPLVCQLFRYGYPLITDTKISYVKVEELDAAFQMMSYITYRMIKKTGEKK